jgi:hypothetical protein
MTSETLPQPDAPVAVDCPWCGAAVELHPTSPALRCAGCATEVDLAPDPVDDADLPVAAVGVAA